jgi:hypothetical protein
MNITIIGAGGTASFLLPVLTRTIRGAEILLVDGDKLEERNLDRQLFSPEMVGLFKAEALAREHNCQYLNEFWQFGMPIGTPGLVIVCADNHQARLDAMKLTDENGVPCIICGNEYVSAQAYIYWRRMCDITWQGTKLDPRVRYPDLLLEPPIHRESCQGVAQAVTPQLAAANHTAANFAMLLLWFWWNERQKLRDASEYFPVQHTSGPSRVQTLQVKDLMG